MSRSTMNGTSRPGLYWGSKPTQLARDVVRLVRSLPRSPRTLVDLGSGEGRDSIYFARRGYRVLGVDISSVGGTKGGATCVSARGQRSISRWGHSDLPTESSSGRGVLLGCPEQPPSSNSGEPI